MTLAGEDAGTGEPGDQNAESDSTPPGPTTYYSLGPEFDERWGVELIAVRDGEEVFAEHPGQHDSATAAKAGRPVPRGLPQHPRHPPRGNAMPTTTIHNAGLEEITFTADAVGRTHLGAAFDLQVKVVPAMQRAAARR